MEAPARPAPPLPSYEWLRERMSAFTTEHLVGIEPAAFEATIRELLQMRDAAVEGYVDPSRQRDLSIRFTWGHNHDFGTFAVPGQMGNRHLYMLAMFLDVFGALPRDLHGKRVLDIGVWTGGTSLLLHELGAEVVAVEEVTKYARAVEILRDAFGLSRLQVLNRSLYQCTTPELQDAFDFVLFAGVLYHVTDPPLALRLVFDCLKDGGVCLLETYAIDADGPVLRYAGPNELGPGTQDVLNRGGWNWFLPSAVALQRMLQDVGFVDVQVGPLLADDRLFAVARRERHVDVLRAGLSVPTVR